MFSTLNASPSRRSTLSISIALLAVGFSGAVSAATLSVGPGKTYSTPCKAFAAAGNGDTIEIDASGSYSGDVCGISQSNLTIRGINGRPVINANGQNSQGKGTWVVSGNNTTIENVELAGARVPDLNGAAIRLDGQHLTLRGSYLHDNENGILTSNDGVSNIIIENTEFAYNGHGDGYSHNLYIGHVNSLVFRYNYSHDANIGHNLKSRANSNTILYSRFSSSSGQPSYEIDLPNAGTSYVIGNVIQQPASNQNPALLAYGEEGASNGGQDLYVVNNTFLNDDSSRGTFIMVGSGVTTPVLMQNNIFAGTGNATTQGNAIDKNNYRSLTPAFVNRANFDLRPASGSPMINGGAAAGNASSGQSLAATMQYKHVAGSESRATDGSIDIGAYEAPSTSSSSSTTSSSSSTTSSATTAPPPASSSTSSSTTWVDCAAEFTTCSFSGTKQVRYGIVGAYVYKSVTGPVNCDNSIFGDPAVGYAKRCAYAASTASSTPTASTDSSAASQNYTYCSAEWNYCSFSGTATVRYGANGSYFYKTVTGGTACSNDTFGDPAVGTVKSCSYAPAASTTISYTYCSGEWGYCSFSGTRQVRYGANNSYFYKTVTGGISCTNDNFGDPAVGITKSCYLVN